MRLRWRRIEVRVIQPNGPSGARRALQVKRRGLRCLLGTAALVTSKRAGPNAADFRYPENSLRGAGNWDFLPVVGPRAWAGARRESPAGGAQAGTRAASSLPYAPETGAHFTSRLSP